MPLTRLHLEGSAYQIGYDLGLFGREAVHKHLRPLPLWRFLAAQAQSPAGLQMRQWVQLDYPVYWQEIEGLAAGLQLPVDEVFLWNCRGDFVSAHDSVDGCTTLFSHTPDGTLIAHNEDGLPQLRGHCAIVDARPETGLAFTSFVYPGSIPGHTFAVNEKGLVATVNNIRPERIPAGIPRQILGRATLDAASLEAAIEVVSHPGRAGAFHHGFGQVGNTRLVSVEASAQGVSVIDVRQPAGHANHLVSATLGRVEQRITDSSAARQERLEHLLKPIPGQLTPAQALQILRDENDPRLPIYRCAADDPDAENTLASALFSIGASAVEWRVYARRETVSADVSGML